jgi:hypothetical protein
MPCTSVDRYQLFRIKSATIFWVEEFLQNIGILTYIAKCNVLTPEETL